MAEFLAYSNKTQSNIIPKDEFEGLALEVFGIIAENLSRSLGPLGSSATIIDGMITEATKDGYAILNKYRFRNRYKKMIYNLILAPCTRMNNTVGDGTTTAIALTNALFAQYKDRRDLLSTLYRLPRNFTQVWDSCIHDICELVSGMAVPVDPTDYDTIYNLAYVTSNGNEEISKAIAEIYRESGGPSIKQKDSPTNKSYISPINGFDFPANLIDEIWVRNEDRSTQEPDIQVMILDHKVDTDILNNVIKPINEVMRARGTKLLVLAPFFDALMCNTVLEQYIRMEFQVHGGPNLIMAQYELGKLAKHQLNDLAVILRAKVITQDFMKVLTDEMLNKNIDSIIDDMLENDQSPIYRMIGFADGAILTCKNGAVFRVNGIESDDRYQDTLRSAQRDLDDVLTQTSYERKSYAAKIYEAKARLMQLQMKNYIYYIGADSELQKQITWDAVEDVIKCLRSATRTGVVPGCQLSIIKACNDLLHSIATKDYDAGLSEEELNQVKNKDRLRMEILTMIYAAVVDVYSRVLHGPENMGMVKLIPNWQFIDPKNKEAIDAIKTQASEKAKKIVTESIEKNQVFDMETLQYNPGIITSAETDTMVLSAASDLVKVLISGNQCVFCDSDLDESHEEQHEVYV